MPRLFKILIILLALSLSIFLLVFKPVSKEGYNNQELYDMLEVQMGLEMKRLDLRPGKELKAGWARRSIIPKSKVPIASYGIRPDFDSIHDTVYASVFVFDNGVSEASLVTVDLLIFPPALYEYLGERLGEKTLKTFYFSASHTHNGPGGWLKGPAARFIAGTFDQEYLELLGNNIIDAYQSAQKNKSKSSISFNILTENRFVKNRIHRNDKKDSTLRYITLENETGAKSAIVSYSAHPNCISHKIDQISRDYPGEISTCLEKNGYEMTAFIAGPVGSMGNECLGLKNYECTGLIGRNLGEKILKNPIDMHEASQTEILVGKIDMPLKSPSPRVLKDWSLQPKVFKFLLGEQNPFISFLKIGDIILIGTPCDYSGVLAKEIYKNHSDQKIIISSFNGNYGGYITPDRYFDLDENETREMNWYGYGSGTFFNKIINSLLKKLQ